MTYSDISNKLKNDIKNVDKTNMRCMRNIINTYNQACKKFSSEVSPNMHKLGKNYVRKNSSGRFYIYRYPRMCHMDAVVKKNRPPPMKMRNVVIDRNTLSRLDEIIRRKQTFS